MEGGGGGIFTDFLKKDYSNTNYSKTIFENF